MKYDAFISYRHTEPDMFVAKKVHKTLETFKVPRKIRKLSGKKKINRVFRDQEELPIGSDLGNNIESALQNSEFLIVICSPRVKQSEWVLREIDTFIAMHGRENILAVLVEGEPSESFPEALLSDENGNSVEPLAADVRGSSEREIKKKLKAECMRLAAPILGCSYDDLRQRHRERKMRKYFAIAMGVALLGVSFGVYNAMVAHQLNEKNLEITKKNEEISRKNDEISKKSEEISQKNEQMLINQSKFLADLSVSIYNSGDRKTAALIAMEGLPKDNERPVVPDSIYALSTALDVYAIGSALSYDLVLSHDQVVDSMIISPDYPIVASKDTGHGVYLFDSETGERLLKIDPEFNDNKKNNVLDIGLLGKDLVTLNQYDFKRVSIEDGEIYRIPYGKNITFAKFNKDYTLAYVSSLTSFTIYNTENGDAIFSMKNDIPESFGADVAFSEDEKYVAISQTDSFKNKGYITIVNIETGDFSRTEINTNTVLDIAFTEDGDVLAAHIDFNDLLSVHSSKFYVCKLRYNVKTPIWNTELPFPGSSITGGYTRLVSRTYTEGDQVFREVFVSAGRNLTNLNLDTGKEIATFSVGSDILNVIPIKDSNQGYVSEVNGLLSYCNFTTGTLHSANTMNIADSLRDLKICKGLVAARVPYSSEILLLRYVKGDDVTLVSEEPGDILSVVAAPDESTFCSYSRESYEAKTVNANIFDTVTNKLIRSVTIEDISNFDPFYLDNDRIAFFSSYGVVYVYTISSDKLESFTVIDTKYSANYCLSDDRSLLLVTKSRDYNLVSLKDFSVLKSGSFDTSLSDVLLTNDGSTFLGTTYGYDVYTGSFDDGVCNQFTDKHAYIIDVSQDGKLLAMACTDGFIRVYEVGSKDLVCEINSYTASNSFIKFSQDGRYLYFQPSDLRFRIYDLKEREFKFVSSTAYSTVSSVAYDSDTKSLAVKDVLNMYLIDCESFGTLSAAPYGRLFMPKNKVLISYKYSDLYRIKFFSLEELLEIANKRYGGLTLSSEQRLAYFLD